MKAAEESSQLSGISRTRLALRLNQALLLRAAIQWNFDGLGMDFEAEF